MNIDPAFFPPKIKALFKNFEKSRGELPPPPLVTRLLTEEEYVF